MSPAHHPGPGTQPDGDVGDVVGRAAYNNGILPYKRYILGESYMPDGTAAIIKNPLQVDDALFHARGILDQLYPLPAWETVPPADVFRVFERGGRVINSIFPEVGLPNVTGQLQRLDEPGRPDLKQSNRGPGTGNRIAVPVINLTKTRLNDPHLWFLGTNDNPGDYRSSGCTACHTIYANDRDPLHAGAYGAFGNRGHTQTADPTIPRDEPGHPLRHEFTRAIPSSQCMVCHMHQPNIYLNTYYGFIQTDYEADAAFLWPKEQKYPSDAEIRAINERNPEEAAIRGLWSDPEYLAEISRLNPQLEHTQFADYHGHGWVFRAVFKRNRKGALLDAKGEIVADDDPHKFSKAVHLASIHMDLGMHCVDCHFGQDTHGNGHIYGEVAAAIEIDCADCHGTATRYPNLHTSGPAAQPGGRDLSLLTTQDGRKRFEWRDGALYQRSALHPDREWKLSLVRDTVNRDHPDYNAKAARAKLMGSGAEGRRSGARRRRRGPRRRQRCCVSPVHLSWTTSCGGCHLPIGRLEDRAQALRGGESRNYATYNVQVARDDMFQLGRHGPVKGTASRRYARVRHSCSRRRTPIANASTSSRSPASYSSQAFARTTRTRAQGRDQDLQRLPRVGAERQQRHHGATAAAGDQFRELRRGLRHGRRGTSRRRGRGDRTRRTTGGDRELSAPVCLPGLLCRPRAARPPVARSPRPPHAGCGTLRAVARRILLCRRRAEWFPRLRYRGHSQQGFSQRIVSAPFSPLGHDAHVASTNATCMALPTNQPVAPARNQGELMREDQPGAARASIYHYAFVTDAEEGLIVVNVDTFADGEPRNNFLERALTWNEGGALDGARHIVLGGHYAYIAVPDGIRIVDLDDPLAPRLVASVPLSDARASALQFRYLFATAADGLRVIDVTHPTEPRLLPAAIALDDARRVYLARTYAYVAAGRDGLVIVDIERPEAPVVYQRFDADGRISDAYDVVVGSTNASLFAYVADGVNGLKVVQLTAPDTQPRFYGFSPEPKPQLIAERKTRSAAVALSKGLDRDRAVDETGGQIAVFGRIGSRPFTAEEMAKMYQNPDGSVWHVSDEVRVQDYVPRKQP